MYSSVTPETPAQKPASLIRQTGAGYFPIALIARLPFAMMVVGVLTLVVAARDSIALGGATSALTGLGTALIGPLLGAAADKFGQRPVLLIAGLVNSGLLALMAWLAFSPAPNSTLLVIAFLIGASTPQVAPLSRSRLVGIITRVYPRPRAAKVLNGTMAYESAADEMAFVFGPVVVGVLATTLSPTAPVIGAAVLAVVFVTAFALHPTAKAAPTGDEVPVAPAPVRDLFRFGVLVTVIGTFGMGLFFGTALTALTAFMGERGAPEQAGLVYGAMGLGSAILALSVALFPARFTLTARWITFGVILTVGAITLPFVTTVPAMVLALLVIGTGIGPALVTMYTLAAGRSPRARSSTVMTMMGSGVIVGQSGASALVGALAEVSGAGAALWTPLVAAGIVLGAGVANGLHGRRR
ncbi:MFS transporter [Microbacterium aquimaris]|uniref:MFS transporter n=1 Tax=Microbacterium aquimaris TaxID=459816 RepID=A0ABU5N2D1_9MICO|nr:MFS transporter [Microbacterium aquimaris]MDZ8160240.1 MFS transporter [Microbacterium aquimaris]